MNDKEGGTNEARKAISGLTLVRLEYESGKEVYLNPQAIESVRTEDSDALIRMVSGEQFRVAGVATSEKWFNFLLMLMENFGFTLN